ncbi:MAG: putative porin [Alistipes finegoldii]
MRPVTIPHCRRFTTSARSSGNYPYVDAFVMGKWKRMRIFLKYQHVNKGLFGNGEYFSAANYPLNPGMFKIGISWGFYD